MVATLEVVVAIDYLQGFWLTYGVIRATLGLSGGSSTSHQARPGLKVVGAAGFGAVRSG
jgi:hypothetical protein